MTSPPELFWLFAGLGLMWFLMFFGLALLFGGVERILPRRPLLGTGMWTTLYRIGIVALLLQIGNPSPTWRGEIGEVGVWAALIGASGPFLLAYLRTAWSVLQTRRSSKEVADE